jgi:hypothetical protein
VGAAEAATPMLNRNNTEIAAAIRETELVLGRMVRPSFQYCTGGKTPTALENVSGQKVRRAEGPRNPVTKVT